MNNIIAKKSEILFLYESKYSMPNGDPFTGEQRIDEITKKALVSDVRIKRFIRDYLHHLGKEEIYVIDDKSMAEGKESGSAARIKAIKEKYKEELKDFEKNKKFSAGLFCLKKCIDVRLFGGISSQKGDAVNLTGPVQFALLNPSLNSVDLRVHQNTSVFSSSADKKQGAIGTTALVPYALNLIHGWANPFLAKHTGLTSEDLETMYKATWHSINNANTRSKSNQNSLLLLEIVYRDITDKLYGLENLIKLNSAKAKEEDCRSLEDCNLDFSELLNKLKSEKIEQINYKTELDSIDAVFSKESKFKKMEF